jgi:hypothetical protein
MPRTRGRGLTKRPRPLPRICRRRVGRRGPASGPSPAAPLTAVPPVAVPRVACPRVGRLQVTIPRVAVPSIAVPRIGRMGPVLTPAGTGTFGAGITSRPAIGRLRFFAAAALAPRPLGRDRIRLGLRRPAPAQVREPLVVGIVPGATTALIPLILVTAAPGSPWIRDSLGNRGPSTLG